MQEGSDDEDEFVYSGVSAVPPAGPEPEHELQSLPDPLSGTPSPVSPASPHPTSKSHISPAQLEALHAAAASGDLTRVRDQFRAAIETGDVEPFALANDASPRTGLTALHAAASRGYLDIVKWLVAECGAIPDIEDKEGEVRVVRLVRLVFTAV
ncbi:hypothetical protein BKA93DRAFT_281206 [Sparassis latifolia]